MSMFESIRQGLQEAIDFAEGKPVKAVVHDVSPPDVKAVREHVGMTQAEFAAPPAASVSERSAAPEKRRPHYMKAEEFDKKFDDGEEDITGLLDLSKARRPVYEQRRVNVDFPLWMISLLDREAGRLGVPRQSLIKMIVSQHLEARAA